MNVSEPQIDPRFLSDEIDLIIKNSIDEAIMSAQFHHEKVKRWTANVVELCMKRLADLDKPFKYVVTCIIMQKNGAGMSTATSCFWDTNVDGSRTIRWENKSMYCIVTVFGLGM
ncbi:hypothetical protein GOP47_0006131 [Adiantum capillus-veneris]|uniref:Dynein light chain n=1 Tax=Adiantum capillus-veneris TaxID=13818 RepID=A0A9D4ZMR6_ADICA|nr:hypothetical protein GOP47_0006131 [Adiantum capillus-veneris]